MTVGDRQALREEIWWALEESEDSRFPGARGRIPNFEGRNAAAEGVLEQPCFQSAEHLKVNPDSPQTPVRKQALARGRTLYMAVPRLRRKKCFLELEPSRMDGSPEDWCSIRGANRHGRPVHPEEMPTLDMIVTGAVGVDPEGRRLGKGGGYSDLEFAVLLEFDRIEPDVPIWSSVHPVQELEPGRIPRDPHDLTLSGYARPDGVRTVEQPLERPSGLDPERLTEDQRADIPVLEALL